MLATNEVEPLLHIGLMDEACRVAFSGGLEEGIEVKLVELALYGN